MQLDVTRLPPMLQLHAVGVHRYEGQPEHGGDAEIARNVVFGGQILAQMIMAAHLDRNQDREDDKEVKSIHAIFARAGDYTGSIVYEVERMRAYLMAMGLRGDPTALTIGNAPAGNPDPEPLRSRATLSWARVIPGGTVPWMVPSG